MKTRDQVLKIKAVLLYILSRFPEGVDYIKLFKILYFAQQDHLVRYGRGVVEDSFKAIKHGPVPTYTYKALQIAEGKPLEGDFADFLKNITVKDSLVYSSIAPDMDELSGSDIKSLDASISKCKDANSYDLSELSHDKAWEEAYSRSQEDPEKDFMSIIDIAKAGNASQRMVDYIREQQILKKAFLS